MPQVILTLCIYLLVAIVPASASLRLASEQTGAVWVPPVNETYGFDATGNRQSSALWDYGWDGRNKLVRARTKNHDASVRGYDITFDYDSEGRRFKKNVKVYQNGVLVSQNRITFVWDGWDMIYELHQNPSGLTTLERKYVWGPDIAGGTGGDSGAGGAGGLLLIRETRGTQTKDYYPLYDGSGHVVALADNDGVLKAEYTYGPFGELIKSSGPLAQSNPIRYATKYFDIETGLYDFGQRYYDPVNGQWLSRELMGEDESINLYAYCHNDPVNNVDALGLKEQVIAGSAPVFFQDPDNPLSVLMGFPLEEDGCFSPFAPNGKYGLVQMAMPKEAAEQYLAHPELIGMLRKSAVGYLEADRLQRIARNGEVAIFYTANTLQVAGGYAEAAGGVALAPETGGVSLLAVAHGADVSATAIRRLAAGPGIDVQSATSTGLQMIGLSRGAAETTDTVASLIGAGGAMYAVGKGPLIFAPSMTNAANSELLRFSRSSGGSRPVFASREAFDNALLDPTLYGTRLTKIPTFNPDLLDDGLTIGRGLNAKVEIGPSAFASRDNLLRTIFHEETHIRLDLRTARGSHRADLLQSSRVLEEGYVETVAERFVRRFGWRGE